MVDFQKVFFKQVTAAFITIAIYAVLTGELKDAMIFSWMYVGVLCFQEYFLTRWEEKRTGGERKTDASGRCGKSA